MHGSCCVMVWPPQKLTGVILQGEVAELLHHFKMMSQTAGGLTKKQKGQQPRGMPAGAAQAAALQRALPAPLLAQMQQQGMTMDDMLKMAQDMQQGGGPMGGMGGGRGGRGMGRGVPGMPF